jgi:hypothetical protein
MPASDWWLLTKVASGVLDRWALLELQSYVPFTAAAESQPWFVHQLLHPIFNSIFFV